MKDVDLKNLSNIVVHNVFIWNHLVIESKFEFVKFGTQIL
jgi:hypothetical protein